MTTAMNPGLGGGPLLDMQGRMAGISALNLNEIGGFSLAIPAEYYLDARDEFLAGGGRGMGTRAWLGVFCYAMNHHVVIGGVLPGGPGDPAGLEAGGGVVGRVEGGGRGPGGGRGGRPESPPPLPPSRARPAGRAGDAQGLPRQRG